MKFGRIYSIYVQGETQFHKIDYPLTCKFTAQNSTRFTYGSAKFQIYNLSKEVRNDLYQDVFAIRQYRQIKFAAGYKTESQNTGAINLPMVFQGNIEYCYTYREGADWVTEIQCFDGAHAGSVSSINFTSPANYRFTDIVSKIINTMNPTVKLGIIGGIESSVQSQRRGITLCGNPWDLLIRTVTPIGLQAYIYQENVFVMKQNEYILENGGYDLISEETGMIGSPKMQNNQVIVTMVFEPRIKVKQKIELKTLGYIDPRMNGFYNVMSISHQGTISGAVCENLYTVVALLRPLGGLKPV